MDLKEWRARQRRTLALPSGLAVMLRHVTLVDLAARGSIPTPLVGLVNEAISGKTIAVVQVQDFERYGQMIDLVVKAAIIEPPIADVGDDEHLGLDEMPVEDKVAIFNDIHGPSEQLAPFRAQPALAVGAEPDRQGIQPEAEQHPESA